MVNVCTKLNSIHCLNNSNIVVVVVNVYSEINTFIQIKEGLTTLCSPTVVVGNTKGS